MLLASIDVETTGLDCMRHQILEVAIIFDHDQETPIEELPFLHLAIKHDEVIGDAYAIAMNADLLRYISGYSGAKLSGAGNTPLSIVDAREARESILQMIVWQLDRAINQRASSTGKEKWFPVCKNGRFDLNFLEFSLNVKSKILGHRIVDPQPMFIEPTDDAPPDLKLVLTRAGIEFDQNALHSAYYDAAQTLRAVRKGLNY